MQVLVAMRSKLEPSAMAAPSLDAMDVEGVPGEDGDGDGGGGGDGDDDEGAVVKSF